MVTDARRTSIPKATIVAAECPDCLLVKGSAPGVAYAWPDGMTMCVDCACVDVEPIDLDALDRDPAYALDGDGWSRPYVSRRVLTVLFALGAVALLVAFIRIAAHLAEGV